MGRNSWTLMHRFNLCHDLLDRVGNNEHGFALLFVWLRFSALRQLDWQRNYNTQPRELGHALDRLTLKLVDIYVRSKPVIRELIRLILTSLGRGGEGQLIRDEMLNIMHRHDIKEDPNTFMEQWHQKIHNNTTPDDIVICEAYLEFLRSNGDLGSFYRTLEAGSVTKKRLEGFERPIVSEPDFVLYQREGLIHDFENYLKLLKSVLSGTDLESAINAARHLLDEELSNLLDFLRYHRSGDTVPVVDFVSKITTARHRLNKLLEKERDKVRVRDLLFLDLALEDFLRVVVERSIHHHLGEEQLVELTGLAIENLCLSYNDHELLLCFRYWERLKGIAQLNRDWSLRAKPALDRLGLALGLFTDRYYQLLQPKAEYLGRAFHADSWTITLFSQEVVRGRPAFVLSTLMRHLDPLLREIANLGNWQVISPGKGVGRLDVVDTLRTIQGKSYDSPTIIIADKVMGNEEIPDGVTAVVTLDPIDILSHVAIRARNARVFFAICFEGQIIDNLKSLKGHMLKLRVSASGDVEFEESSDEIGANSGGLERLEIPEMICRPDFDTYAISSKEFNDSLVGGKSNNLVRLQGRLSEWIHLPSSVALPFCVFEKVLNLNKEAAKHYEKLLSRINEEPTEVPSELRKTIMTLEPPEELLSSLRKVIDKEGLELPQNGNVWKCIKHVWASKWNERAFLSRKKRGIPHDKLFMAVLIQQVVEAEYAFVIHTANPLTSDKKDELYAEVVLGLGETLVANYPGKALSFSFQKGTGELNVLSYPSKSIGLFGGGLIFRSDSNGEDMAGYAGAGLYDSIMLEPPLKVLLDYTEEPLVWDEKFRKNFLVNIARIGMEVEKVFGTPQDIEGAYVRGKYYVVQTRPQ